jgi:serine/threonine protein kinase
MPMTAAPDCPEMASWRALFDGALPPDRREDYERHLESCPACQARLDRDELGEERLRRMVRHVDDPGAAAADPTLRQFLDRLRHGPSSERPGAPQPLDLSFLQPAARPGLLGNLGAYEVEEVLGRGGMGVVLKAFDPRLRRYVAIKVLAPALAGTATARQRFTREAQAAAAVRHEHVVAVHGVAEAEGLPYLVMQYVAGESLQARLDRAGSVELTEAVRIGMETASGLAAAHAQGLIHRDVKPANILLERRSHKRPACELPAEPASGPLAATEDVVKLTDFGLARAVDDVGLTQQGVVAGTPEYMAPEQARGEEIGPRADLYALGAVLYACCTGEPPFRGETPLAVLRRVSDEAPTPVRKLNPAVPAWLEALISRLLAKDPAERFQSAAEVAALLEGFLAHLRQPARVAAPELPAPGMARPEQPPARARPHGVSRTVGRLLGLALLVVLAGLGLVARTGLPGSAAPPQQAAPAGPAQRARGHVAFDLRAGLAGYPALTLEGPETDTAVAADAEGLRVTIPAGRQDTRPTLLRLPHRLRGDFDVAVSYDLLAVGKPAPEYGAGVALRVLFDSADGATAILGRGRKPHGDRFGAHTTVKQSDGKDKYLNNVDAPATGPRGKLRLVRTGSRVRFVVAEEGKDPRTLESVEVGTADVQAVQVDCFTMYKPIALDVRLRELVVDANEFPEGMPTVPAAAPVANPPAPPAGEFFQDFRGGQPPLPPLHLAGPDAPAVTRSEEGGFRITLPRDRKQTDRVGLELTTRIKGDFEITTAYEILQAEQPVKGHGVAFDVVVETDTPRNDVVELARARRPGEGEVYNCARISTDDQGERTYHHNFPPAAGDRGRLRLTRTGRSVTLWAAEGAAGDFQELASYDLGPEDVKKVSVTAFPGYAPNLLDLRILDLRVHVRNAAEAAAQGAVSTGHRQGPTGGWLAAAGLIALLILLAALGAWLLGLRRRRAPGESHPARQLARFWPLALLPAVLAAGLLAWGFAGRGDAPTAPEDGQPPAGRAAFDQDFRAADFDPAILQPFGPGVERDDKGLRITLAAGADGPPNAGINTAFPVRGDFEITATYEVVSAGRPSTGYGVGVGLYAPIDPDNQDAASLSRRLSPDGTARFVSNRMTPGDGGQVKHRVKTIPTTSPVGKLRLERVGPVLRYLVADGADAPFVLLDEVDFGAADLRFVRVEGSSGASQAGLDARVLNFSVRAGELPGLSGAAAPEKSGRQGWFAAAAVLGLVVTLLGFLGAWLSARRRRPAGERPASVPGPEREARPAAAAPSVLVTCSGCGKKFRARAQLAGKRVQCPQCRQPLLIPGPSTDVTSRGPA